MLEVPRHYVTWSLNNIVMTSEWTSCETADASGQPQEPPCAESRESSPVALSGKTLTVLKKDQPLVFTRD